jgi:hypothetical protein
LIFWPATVVVIVVSLVGKVTGTDNEALTSMGAFGTVSVAIP